MIYLDNCATTKIRREVIEIMSRSLEEDFGNPSSLHRLGLNTEKKIEKSRENIGNLLGVKSKEIYFTSGGTESNNLAIQSIASKYKNRGNHIITTNIEHPSVENIMKDLETKGYIISYLKVDNKGFIDLEEFERLLNEETILVSLIHVNNEIGSIQNIEKIREIMDIRESKALLHLDGVQSFGKIDFSPRSLGVDTYSFSSHKIHGPKGIGGIYINENTHLNPIVFGGNQEKGLRSGTENVTGIIGFGEAARLQKENFIEDTKHIEEIKSYTRERLMEIEDIKINTPVDNSSPYILSVSIEDTRGEVLLHYLEDEDIYISTSSACSSNGTEKSHVLKNIGLKNNEIEGTIRICFSYEISKSDIDFFIEVLKKSVEEIRDIMR